MSIDNKYNKKNKELPKSKGNRDVLTKIIGTNNTDIHNSVNTEIQLPVNTAKKSIKKATFELDSKLHKRLRSFAVDSEKTMVDIVEKALIEYMDKNENNRG